MIKMTRYFLWNRIDPAGSLNSFDPDQQLLLYYIELVNNNCIYIKYD